MSVEGAAPAAVSVGALIVPTFRRASRPTLSLIPSPTRLKQTTVMTMHSPGHTMSHGELVVNLIEPASIVPQLESGGIAPRPTKLSPASTIIATPASTVIMTMSGDRMCGTTCRRRIVDRRRPRLRAASTNVSSRTARVASRVMRANRGANTRPTAIIEFVRPGPMAATTAMARMIGGNAMNASMNRMTTQSRAAAEVPGEEAGEEPDEHADPDGLHGCEQREARPVHQPAEHVATEVVRAQQVSWRNLVGAGWPAGPGRSGRVAPTAGRRSPRSR